MFCLKQFNPKGEVMRSFKAIAIVAALASTMLSVANAGTAVSGGGGAYVYRAGDEGPVMSSILVDLWESENTPFVWQAGASAEMIKVDYNKTADVQLQIDRAIARLTAMDSDLGAIVSQEIKQMQKSLRYLPLEVGLTLPNDLQTDYYPVNAHPEGMMRYNGYSHQLDIKKEIFDKLETNTDKAAAFLHEGIYKAFRDGLDQAQNSILTRRLVACLFSQECVAMVPPILPTDRDIYSCQNKDFEMTIYENKVAQGEWPSWHYILRRAGTTYFAADVSGDVEMSSYPPGSGRTERGTALGGWFEKFGFSPGEAFIQIFPSNETHGAPALRVMGSVKSRLVGNKDLFFSTPVGGNVTCSLSN
jgi:hypothetical protein